MYFDKGARNAVKNLREDATQDTKDDGDQRETPSGRILRTRKDIETWKSF